MFETLLFTMLEFLFYMLLVSKLLQKKIPIVSSLICMLCTGLIVGTLEALQGQVFVNIISIVLIIGMLKGLYKIDIKVSILAFIISSIIIYAVQFVSILPIMFLTSGLDKTFCHGLISQLISLVVIVFIAKVVPINKFKYYIEYENSSFFIIVTVLYFSMFGLVIFWNIDISVILAYFPMVIVVVMMTILMTLVIFRNGLKNYEVITQLELHNQYMPVIDGLVDDIRVTQHEFNNHLQAIKLLVYTGESLDDVKVELESYVTGLEELYEFQEFAKLSNRVIGGFLYTKKNKAELAGIRFNVRIDAPNLSEHVPDFNWIELLGILIDNAIEATVVGGEIIVETKSQGHCDIITVKNTHTYIEKSEFSRFLKKDDPVNQKIEDLV